MLGITIGTICLNRTHQLSDNLGYRHATPTQPTRADDVEDHEYEYSTNTLRSLRYRFGWLTASSILFYFNN